MQVGLSGLSTRGHLSYQILAGTCGPLSGNYHVQLDFQPREFTQCSI